MPGGSRTAATPEAKGPPPSGAAAPALGDLPAIVPILTGVAIGTLAGLLSESGG